MTPQQLHNLETYVLRIQQRQRVVKAVIKALFVLIVTCCVLAFWASLVGCSLMQPIRHLDDLGDDSGDPVWPDQCANLNRQDSELHKLTER